MIKSAAIQGIKGSFHHIVSKEFFENEVEVDECMTFDETVNSVMTGKTDVAIMAIENSIAGSIIPNYSLIDTNELHIIGEHFLDIQHHLMAWPNQSLKDLKEVWSHPMALLQCKAFFKNHPHIRLVEDKDTAEVAKRIQEKKIENVAAIASGLAAQLYDLEIISKSIQTIAHNETRFVIVKKQNSVIPEEQINKASVKFELEHKRGSLASVLNVFSDCKLNLTKIQSLPKIDTLWKYAFFVDVTFQSYKDFEKTKAIMNIMAQDFKVLGEYKNARL